MVFTPPSVPPLAGDRNLREEEGNRPTRCSEPLRSKVGGASKPSPDIVRDGTALLQLASGLRHVVRDGPPGNSSLLFTVDFVVIC